MKPVFGTVLTSVCLTAAASAFLARGTAQAAPGDIQAFLDDVRSNGRSVTLFHLTSPSVVNASRPDPDSGDLAALIGSGAAADLARNRLWATLRTLSVTPLPAFHPDYCVAYTDPTTGDEKVLWIDSRPGELQMQLFVSGSATAVDSSGIQPLAAGVQQNLASTVRSMSFGAILQSPMNPSSGGPPPLIASFELMSVDPKKVNTVFGQPFWTSIGKIPLNTLAEQQEVMAAIKGEFDPPAPTYTAHVFTPRLGVTAVSGPHQYLLLMSFECRKAELFVDGAFSCTFPINNNNRANQRLNDLLDRRGISLKPKTASSGS